MSMSSATYTKLKSGEWGLRVAGHVSANSRIIVTKKSGETKTEVIGKVLWQGEEYALCSIAPQEGDTHQGKVWDASAFNGYGAPKGRFRRACKTGGNCSSVGNGKSCGGYDCDGF